MSDELFRLIDKLHLTQRRRTLYHARLGDGQGNLLVVDEAGNTRTGYNWALVEFGDGTGATMRQVRNRKVAEQYGLGVLVMYGLDGMLEVVEEDVTTAQYMARDHGSANSPQHAWTHSLLGPDPAYIQGLQFLPGLVHPTSPEPSMKVAVESFHYRYEDQQKYYGGGLVTLSGGLAYVSEGQQLLVIVTFNPSTNLASWAYDPDLGKAPYVVGDANAPYSGEDIAAVDIGTLSIRMAALRLYYGMTQIVWTDFLADMRMHMAWDLSTTSPDWYGRFMSWGGF